MIKAGITGGIGSGKTIICRAFETFGVPVYNADLAARLLTDSHPEIRKCLTEAFGEDIYIGNALNRPRFASLVFRDRQLLETANRIIHPWVKEDFNRWATTHEDCNYIIEEAAILFESGSHALVDKCITVISPAELRIKRLMNRSGMTLDRIEDVMDNQWSDEKKIAASDFIIINDEKQPVLPQILSIHQRLIELSEISSKDN
jgi:dephospho-CoA kinase